MSNLFEPSLPSTEALSHIEKTISTQISHEIPSITHNTNFYADSNNKLSLTFSTEISIENYEAVKHGIVLVVLRIVAPFFRELTMIDRLTMRFDVSDDKIAVSDEYILREDLLVWEQNPEDDDLFQYIQSYW